MARVGLIRFTPTCVGKTGARSSTTRTVSGSPPHAWGRQSGLFGEYEIGQRFTPTCVGKTEEEIDGGLMSAVHPHMRGEDAPAIACVGPTPGSPPHAWGRHVGRGCIERVRFTPTCVGKTRTGRLNRPSTAVHPHMRGEDANGDALASAAIATVHPHMRGEDSGPLRQSSHRSGSPPHAWGRRHGRTSIPWLSSVHPHMRGEETGPLSLAITGSPPHAWGRRHGDEMHPLQAGSPPHAWGRL